MPGPHPATRLALVCLFALLVEQRTAAQAYGLALLAVSGALAIPVWRSESLRLLRRSRWLLLTVFLVYAWSLPGPALLPEWGSLSPSYTGVQAGATRVVRLGLMVLAVAALFATTAPRRIVYGLYAGLAPLARLGVNRRAVAVRLGLALDYARAAPQGDWRSRLGAADHDTGVPAHYSLEPEPARARDAVWLVVACAGVWW